MQSTIEVKSLTLKLGPEQILNEVSFSISPQSKTAIIGPNGAGKTSLLRSILGFHPSRSNVFIDGERLETISAKRRASKIAYVPQSVSAMPAISAREFLQMSRYAHSTLFDSFSGGSEQIID